MITPGYPAAYTNPYLPQYQQQQQQNTGLIWVQGEAGAKSYLVAPNTTVQLWDSEAQTVYLKSADASGMPTLKILDYTIREAAAPAPAVQDAHSQYITREEFETLQGQIKGLKKQIEKLKGDAANE